MGDEQARAHAAALEAALGDSVATQSDLKDVASAFRRELRDVEVRLDAKIETTAAGLKVEVLRWLIVTQAALGGFIFAVLKFLH